MNALSSRIALSLLTLLALTTLFACGPEEENNTSTTQNNTTTGELKNPLAGDSAAAAAGEQLFKDKGCTGCHGTDGSAGQFANNKALSDTAANKDDAFIYTTISEGVSGTSMAAYKSQLSENEIWQVVTYIRTYAN